MALPASLSSRFTTSTKRPGYLAFARWRTAIHKPASRHGPAMLRSRTFVGENVLPSEPTSCASLDFGTSRTRRDNGDRWPRLVQQCGARNEHCIRLKSQPTMADRWRAVGEKALSHHPHYLPPYALPYRLLAINRPRRRHCCWNPQPIAETIVRCRTSSGRKRRARSTRGSGGEVWRGPFPGRTCTACC
jgi:hypothetical protein